MSSARLTRVARRCVLQCFAYNNRRTCISLHLASSSSTSCSDRLFHHSRIVRGPLAITRDPRYATVTNKDIKHFQDIVGAEYVITDADTLSSYNTDWMRKFHGQSRCVLRPANTDEVSRILTHCHDRTLAVVPQSGNTGLVGGSVPVHDEIVVSLSRLNQIESFDENNGVVTCGSGAILETLNNWLNERGYIVPLDLGAKGSCQIGGNVSTNAGGLRLLRYGSLHGSVLGMEVVLASGKILDLTSTLRKDNTGLDLKQLFIGAEGILGIITKINILAPRKPANTHVALLGVNSFDHVLNTMKAARSQLSDILSACEFLDRASLDLVLKHMSGTRDPMSDPHDFYILIETSGNNVEHDLEKLNIFLENVMTNNIVSDGVITSDITQQKTLWILREQITDALSKSGVVYKYDISVPVQHFYDLVILMRKRLYTHLVHNNNNNNNNKHEKNENNVDLQFGIVGYGHLGDGNLHLNIYTPKFNLFIFNLIEPFLFECVRRLKGSISAEHGLGQSKNIYMNYSKNKNLIDLMRTIKHLFDPKHILNPYKVLPTEEQELKTAIQIQEYMKQENLLDFDTKISSSTKL